MTVCSSMLVMLLACIVLVHNGIAHAAWFQPKKPSLKPSSSLLVQQNKQTFFAAIANVAAVDSQFNQQYVEQALATCVTSNPTATPCAPAVFKEFAQGKWRVCYAPHIRILEKVTLTSYDVYYEFPTPDTMVSYVRYQSPLFRSGWLNTAGRVESVSDNVCRVVWEQIWWDWNEESEGPSKASETEKHVLPRLIQALGEKGFAEGVSRFPVLFLDSDLCVFQFQLIGTKICATRQQ